MNAPIQRDVAVIGAGYVGLIQAVGLAELGHRVRVGERSSTRVAAISAGTPPIHELGLEEALAANPIEAHSENADAVTGAEFVFLAVPTPERPNGSADLTWVEAALSEIEEHLAEGATVVLKSTVPIGTTRKVARAMEARRPDVGIAVNPEFLREGTALADFRSPDRIVVGADDPTVARAVGDLYAGLDAPTLIVVPESAEAIKYASNSYLATRIAFVNELASVCETHGADFASVAEGMGLDHRIGPHFLRPGPGFGGSCFPKDTLALLALADEDPGLPVLRAVVDANRHHQRRFVDLLEEALGGLAGKTVAQWGLAFKAGTDDVRQSPALAMLGDLVERGAKVVAHDPEATLPLTSGGTQVEDPLAALGGADALLVATEWPVYGALRSGEVARALGGRVVVDSRGVLDRDGLIAEGLQVVTVGKPRSRA